MDCFSPSFSFWNESLVFCVQVKGKPVFFVSTCGSRCWCSWLQPLRLSRKKIEGKSVFVFLSHFLYRVYNLPIYPLYRFVTIWDERKKFDLNFKGLKIKLINHLTKHLTVLGLIKCILQGEGKQWCQGVHTSLLQTK